MSLLGLLEEISFFESFTNNEKSSFVQSEDLFVTLKPGEFLIKEGLDPDNAFFIILEGQVTITKDSLPNTVLATLGAGSVLGEMTFLSGNPRSTNVIAEEGVTVFKINQHIMNRLDPHLQVKILRQLTDILIGRLEKLTNDIVQQKRINETLTQALRKHLLSPEHNSTANQES